MFLLLVGCGIVDKISSDSSNTTTNVPETATFSVNTIPTANQVTSLVMTPSDTTKNYWYKIKLISVSGTAKFTMDGNFYTSPSYANSTYGAGGETIDITFVTAGDQWDLGLSVLESTASQDIVSHSTFNITIQ